MQQIPVTIVTGFLGAGKTTLINNLLNDDALTDTAVIVNEFGEIAIDHLLVEQSSDDIYEIAGGCLCCTVRAELTDTLADLVERVHSGKIKQLARIIIETTGMADPAPVLHAVEGNPALGALLAIDRVITVFDAINGLTTLDRYHEAEHQITAADLVLVSKATQTDEAQKNSLRAALAHLTVAQIIFEEEITPNMVQILNRDIGPRHPGAATGSHSHHHHNHHDHSQGVSTQIISHDQPLAWHVVENFLDLVRSRTDFDILRIKGIIETVDDPSRPLIVHGVQRMLYPPRRLEKWPDGSSRGTQLVIIGNGFSGDEIIRIFRAFIGQPQTDMPDKTAMSDNPLAIPGT